MGSILSCSDVTKIDLGNQVPLYHSATVITAVPGNPYQPGPLAKDCRCPGRHPPPESCPPSGVSQALPSPWLPEPREKTALGGKSQPVHGFDHR